MKKFQQYSGDGKTVDNYKGGASISFKLSMVYLVTSYFILTSESYLTFLLAVNFVLQNARDRE